MGIPSLKSAIFNMFNIVFSKTSYKYRKYKRKNHRVCGGYACHFHQFLRWWKIFPLPDGRSSLL